MKNKKGFTLVELLAVIAILAILVIIALPNVVKMFNNAKKSTFLTEAQTIYKEVSKKYISESMKGNKISVIDSNGTKLDIQTSEDLEYNITVDSQGNVSNFKVSNNSYCISGNFGNISDLTIDKVTEGKCTSAIYCNSNKELTKGTTYVNGPYTYRYMIEHDPSAGYIELDDKITAIEPEGWSVELTDKSSTDEVNAPLCTYIDNKPVVSMQSAFFNSNAKKIDLSNSDTSKIISMKWVFGDAKADTIILNNIDTSNVITMTAMFYGIKPKTFDISGLNTEKVYNMSSMFGYSTFDTLDLSTFSTSSLKYINSMFAGSEINKLNLSSFDTSKVEGMIGMFEAAIIPTVDLSNFVFKKDVNISGMFTNSKINTVFVQDEYIQNFNDSTKPSSLEIKSNNK